MKTIWLLRHAKSSWNDPQLPDFDRPLNARGRRDAPLMAKRFHLLQKPLDLLLTSSARRARDTAAAFVQYLPADRLITEDRRYMALAEELLQRIQEINDEVRAAMICGHNPGLHNLTALLLPRPELDHYPTAGLVELTVPADTWPEVSPQTAKLERFLYPKQIYGQAEQ